MATKKLNPTLVAIGQRLTKARADVDLTQEDVGERVGVGKQAYRSYEKGRHPMAVLTLLRLPDVLRRPVTYYLGLEPDLGLSEDEHALVDVYRSIQSPAVRDAARRLVVVLAALDGHSDEAARAIATPGA